MQLRGARRHKKEHWRNFQRADIGSRDKLLGAERLIWWPGEWYLDRETGVLTYYPMPDEKIENFQAVAPVTKTWIKMVGDYRLKPDSPAFKLGFQPLDLEEVGIRPPELRK